MEPPKNYIIAMNPDPSGPTESGLVPACGAMAALIEKVTGVTPYFVGTAQSADDAHGTQLPGSPLREHGHGGRPNGHRYRCRL